MNIQKMMQQAQAMQQRMQEMQEELGTVEVEGVAGGGMVKIVMTCKGEVRSVAIDPSIVDPSDKETLEDLVAAAVNSARTNADQRIADETKKMMDELGLPAGAGAGMPF